MAEFLKVVRLEEIVGGKSSAVAVNTNTSVQEAARILAKKKFRSVPVWDEEEGRYVGFIDEMDLLEHAVLIAHSIFKIEGELTPEKIREKYSHFTAEEINKFTFGTGTVESILKLPGAERRKIHIFESNARLMNAMQIIKSYERVLVRHCSINPYGNTKVKLFVGRLMHRIYRRIDYKICTQTDILRFLVSHLNRNLPEEPYKNTRVMDCGKLKRVISITENERAIDGFLKMLETSRNACAVLDYQGRIIASLSASNLRGLTNEKLRNLLLPVMQFFPAMTGYHAEPPLICKENDNLVETIRKISKASTRRCWVIDDDFRPIGQLSMGNIIEFVFTKPCQHL